MQTQVADPIEKKLQELPGFEKVQTYSKPAFTAMQVTFRDSTSPKDVPYLFYLLRKKTGRRAGTVAGRPARPPSSTNEILRRGFDSLHDDRRRRRLRAVEEGRRRPAAKTAEGAGRHQGRSLWHPRRAHLRRIFACQAGNARHHDRRHCSIRSPSRTMSCRPARWKPRRSACRCASPVRSTAPRPWRKRRSESNGRVFRLGDIATVTPRLCRSADLYGTPGRQARARHRRGQPPRAPNILELGKDVQKATNEFMGAVPQASGSSRSPISRKVVGARRRRNSCIPSSRRWRSCCSFLSWHWAGVPASWWALVGAAGAGDRLHRHECDGRYDLHRITLGAAGSSRSVLWSTRHHRGRDDGGEDGAGLGPCPGGGFRLGIHRFSRC